MPAIPAHQRRDFRELQVELGLLDVRLGRQNRCLGAKLRLNFRIELALRDCARFGQRRVALDIEAGLAELCLRLRQLRLRLIERRLQRPRIDLKEHVAFPYDRSFPVVLLDDVAGDSRLYLRVHVSVQRGHPVAVDRSVALNDRGDFHSGRSRGPTPLCRRRSHPRSGGRQRASAREAARLTEDMKDMRGTPPTWSQQEAHVPRARHRTLAVATDAGEMKSEAVPRIY